jgi:hypothetical protein
MLPRYLLIALALLCAAPAAARWQLYDASWTVKSFGDENLDTHFGMPLGIQCNENYPLCPISRTPTTTFMGAMTFHPRGSSCGPVSYHPGLGGTAWSTYTNAKGHQTRKLLAPRHRPPAAFTAGGQPKRDQCGGADPRAQKGAPLTGSGWVSTWQNGKAFYIGSAYTPYSGIQGKRSGSFPATFPYIYSYTFADLKNNYGTFGNGWGPGSFTVKSERAPGSILASVMVKKGPNQFGGTMRMLGSFVGKTCYYRPGGCSVGSIDWRYEAIGTSAYTNGSGRVSKGYQATATGRYYLTGLRTSTTYSVVGSRFPWTTGSAYVMAGDGPHKTYQRGKGYDNRDADGHGTIQLVSPVLTRWLGPADNFHTAGVAFLKIRFLPEPSALVALPGGALLLLGLRRTKRSTRSGRGGKP